MTFADLAMFARTGGLLYLLFLFLAVLVYALRPGAAEKFAKAARMPLRED